MPSGYVENLLDTVDSLVVTYVFDSYSLLAHEMGTTLRLMFLLFFILYGFSLFLGVTQASVQDFVTNIFKMIFIYVFATNWELFNSIVYVTFTETPSQIGGALLVKSGLSADSVNAALGSIYDVALSAASKMLWETSWMQFASKIVGLGLGVVVSVMIIYALYLITLSKIMIALLLGLSPLFIAFLMFKTTRGLFEGWLRQLFNFALIPILTYALLVFIVALMKNSLIDLSAGIEAESLHDSLIYAVVLVAGVCIALLMQITSVASGIAGGMQLSTLGGAMTSGAKAIGKYTGAAHLGGMNAKMQKVTNSISN